MKNLISKRAKYGAKKKDFCVTKAHCTIQLQVAAKYVVTFYIFPSVIYHVKGHITFIIQASVLQSFFQVILQLMLSSSPVVFNLFSLVIHLTQKKIFAIQPSLLPPQKKKKLKLQDRVHNSKYIFLPSVNETPVLGPVFAEMIPLWLKLTQSHSQVVMYLKFLS